MKRQANETRIDGIVAGLALAVLLTCAPTRVYGYADPGTGTFVYQAAYAVFIGGAFYFRKLVQKLRGRNSNSGR